MEFRHDRFEPEVDYFVDCACECREITGFASAALRLFGDRDRTKSIIRGLGDLTVSTQPRGWQNTRAVICLRLEAYAHELVWDQPLRVQKALLAGDLAYAASWAKDLAECLSSWNFEDETVGGALLPYRKHCRVRRDHGPTPSARRRLYGRRAIRRYVKLDEQTIPHGRRLTRGLRNLPWPEHLDEGRPVVEWLSRQLEIHRERESAMWAAILGRDAPVLAPKARKMLRKSASAAIALVGQAAVSSFVQNRPVLLLGQDVNIELQARGSLTQHGHGGVQVRLLSPEGSHLANLCVYFDKTPVLDQLAAFALHMLAGEERHILSTGNLYGITDAGRAHALLAASSQCNEERYRGRAAFDDHPWIGRRLAVERYQADVLPFYQEVVTERLWGRDAGRVQHLVEAAA